MYRARDFAGEGKEELRKRKDNGIIRNNLKPESKGAAIGQELSPEEDGVITDDVHIDLLCEPRRKKRGMEFLGPCECGHSSPSYDPSDYTSGYCLHNLQ